MNSVPVRCTAALFLMTFSTLSATQEPAGAGNPTNHWSSERGMYVVSFTSSIDPIPINKMLEWTLHLTGANGEPVDDADFSIAGGMPKHNHGLPTSPRVTENLGGGNYRLQGIRFHMKGNWQIILSVFHGPQSDRVVMDLQL